MIPPSKHKGIGSCLLLKKNQPSLGGKMTDKNHKIGTINGSIAIQIHLTIEI